MAEPYANRCTPKPCRKRFAVDFRHIKAAMTFRVEFFGLIDMAVQIGRFSPTTYHRLADCIQLLQALSVEKLVGKENFSKTLTNPPLSLERRTLRRLIYVTSATLRMRTELNRCSVMVAMHPVIDRLALRGKPLVNLRKTFSAPSV